MVSAPATDNVPSYYEASRTYHTNYAPLDGSRTCDVCVVGGGYTGLSAALHLAQRGMDVMLLEAKDVGWGASGRNGGQLGTGQRVDQITLETKFGERHARQLWDIAEDGKALAKSLIAEHKIDCDLTPGIIYADHKRRYVKHSAEYAEHLNTRYRYEQISFLDRTALEGELGTKAYYGGTLDWGAAHLHPLNYALGLAEAAQRAGVKIHTQTPVQTIEDGPKASVHTAQGVVNAEHVVVACNGYLDRLQPKIARHVMPIDSYIIGTEPLSEAIARDLIRQNTAVADSRFVVNYFRLSKDRRMLFGGRESYGYGEPQDIAGAVRQRMLGIYPQLEQAKIDFAWGGTIGITLNRLPYVSKISDRIFTASGFSGHGVGLSVMSGKILAEAIGGQMERYDVMASLPIPQFPGGTSLRRPLLALGMLYYALRDRL